MPFEKIRSEKLAHGVIRQIELLILQGILRPGERLPAERDLALRLDVSRPSLREALAELQARGLVATRAGAGVFVEDGLAAGFAPALIALFGRHAEAVADYVAFRRDLEGLAAERAARAGTETDLAVIAGVLARMEEAHARRAPAEEAALDAAFHLAIVEATHDLVMLHMMRAMHGLLREAVAANRAVMFRQRMTREALLDQHRAINAATQNRDAAAARAAVEAHLDYVACALTAQAAADRFEALARKRLDHPAEGAG